MMVRTLCASAALLALLAAAPASAQTKDGQNSLQSGGSDGNLSSKLSESGGVIKPKADIDPEMHVPAPVPHPNSTPVIPPSATGGNTAK